MIELMKILYDCGAITNEEIEKLGIDFSLIDNLLRKEQLFTKMQGKTIYYYLNDFGEKMYRLETDKKLFYRCANFEKMKTLVSFYSNLTKEERDSWKSKDEWYYEGYVGAIPDATFIKDNLMYGVYIQTENTTKNMIDKIEKFVQENNIENMYYIK